MNADQLLPQTQPPARPMLARIVHHIHPDHFVWVVYAYNFATDDWHVLAYSFNPQSYQVAMLSGDFMLNFCQEQFIQRWSYN